MQYYESIIKNGKINDNLLGEIIAHLEQIYRKTVDTGNLLTDVLKDSDSNGKAELMLLVKENNPELYDKISKNIFNFEDIVNIDIVTAKNVLQGFNTQIIVKALMVASPKINEYVQSFFPDIDFVKERQAIGSIPINEAMNIHDKIIEAINRGVWE